MKLVNDNGERCGVDEDGEIYYKSNVKFNGYYGDQKTTNDALDRDGWSIMGDVGRFDKSGDLYSVDRKKDFVECRGFQVSIRIH